MRILKRFHGAVLAIALALTALTALTAGRASADVTINFQEIPNGNPEPNDANIHLFGFGFDGTPFDFLKLNSEVFHLSSPAIPPGYPADFTLSHIGISLSGVDMLVNILEPDGVTLSDQVFVHKLNSIFTVIDFVSDPEQFFTGQPFATVIENGLLQNVLNYTNDRGELVHINVQSDIDVPEPASLSVLALGGLALLHRRRKS